MHRSILPAMLLQLLLLLSSLALAAPRPYVKTSDLTAPPLDKRQSSGYWMGSITRQGVAAFNSDKSYKIFRNVKDYGAVGDGQADDTDAINRAIAEGNRCGQNTCDSSTTTPAIVYFPAGTYKVSSSIVMYYYTQMIGDAFNRPRIQGSANFNFSGNIALLDADPYVPNGNGANWYTNQNNFYRQIRNLIIDMTQMPEAGPFGQEVNGVHWQVAQACSMQNVLFDMKPATPTSKQRGIMMENGSGMFMADIAFKGGNVGAFLGSQQFATRNFTFDGCNTAIEVHWDWLWTFKSLNIQNCQVGVNMSTTNSVNETVGSAIIMDSVIRNTPVGISTTYGANTKPVAGSTLLVHNVDFPGTNIAILDHRTGNTVLAGNHKVAAWGQGNAYIPSGSSARDKRDPQNGPGIDVSSVGMADPGCSEPPPVVITVTQTVAPVAATSGSSNSSGPPFPIPFTSGPPFSGPPPGFTSPPGSVPTGFPFPGHSTSSAKSANASTPSSSAGNATRTSNAPFTCNASAVIPTKTQVLQQALNAAPIASSLLNADGSVFERSKPQYIDVPASSFVSVRQFGAKGDGVTDDTDAIQKAMDGVTKDQILYFDHGAYLISKTVNVPANIRITGEIWPLIMITGSFFSDQSNPQPGFLIGKPGDIGNVEISDLMFETKGPAPGAIMMQWNVQEASQGSVGMWDTHFRVGGSAGTDLQIEQCGATLSKEFKPECAGSFLMMHITQTASGYFENTWYWVADHDLDRPYLPEKYQLNQTSIFNGRGVLIESKGPVWLWGTSSEHSQLYNYQIANAKNVFMASIQTETAYMQSAPNALNGGFTPNAAYSDPDFADCTSDSCKKTWGLRILGSEDIFMYGGGMYSFFDDYSQTCLDTEDCQENMIDIQCSTGVYMYGFVTKASTNQLVVNGKPAVLEKDNENLFGATVLFYEQQ